MAFLFRVYTLSIVVVICCAAQTVASGAALQGSSAQEIHYTAPLFATPERTRFKYMLEGYDREWVEAGKRRVAYYTNLPRGRSYRFRVIAESEGRWDKTGVSVGFRVASYYWEAWWFYAACLVVLCGIVYQGVQYRTAKLQARTLELERMVEERTQKLQKAHEESESLLLNILPAPIARRLKFGEEYIADYYSQATILFADLCGFTRLAATMTPQEVVAMLNTIFTHFDIIARKHGVEKIKTIGDAYMIVGGVPDQCADHIANVARAALEIQTTLPTLFFETLIGVTVRIGIHTGEVVAGVIGASKFSYDLWGDTVNVASRMESHGEPGKIHCSHDVYLALREQFLFEPCSDQYIKGKGTMQTWFLVGAK